MFAPSPHMSKNPQSEQEGWLYIYTHGCAGEYCLQISSSIAENDKYDVFLGS